jgi:hypothetical protein
MNEPTNFYRSRVPYSKATNGACSLRPARDSRWKVYH